MTSYYNIIDTLKTALEAEPFVNTVSYGNIYDIDLSKQTIFPLSHIMVNQATISAPVITFNVTIMCMDIVDDPKTENTSTFLGNNNEQDILNTQLNVADRIVSKLMRGDLFSDLYQIEGTATCEPFNERFENSLTGWAVTFDVNVPNPMTIC
tara:strand:+ start:1083 stop:1538 length:456 start_codon:yes stop_codon:yes gene_type:complete